MKKLGERTAFDGWRGIVQRTYALPNGREITYDVVRNNHFVTVAAFTPRREAILVKQWRPGPERELWSFPEGFLDAAETPVEAARRELLEETGYRAGTLRPLREYRASYSTERRFCLVATDCERIGTQRLDADEFVEVFTLPLPEFRALLRGTDDRMINVDAGYQALDVLGWL